MLTCKYATVSNPGYVVYNIYTVTVTQLLDTSKYILYYNVLSQAILPHCCSSLLVNPCLTPHLTAALLTSLPPLLLTANAAPHLIVSPTMYKNCYYHPRLISQFVCALLA